MIKTQCKFDRCVYIETLTLGNTWRCQNDDQFRKNKIIFHFVVLLMYYATYFTLYMYLVNYQDHLMFELRKRIF